jgi:hypothetical protein
MEECYCSCPCCFPFELRGCVHPFEGSRLPAVVPWKRSPVVVSQAVQNLRTGQRRGRETEMGMADGTGKQQTGKENRTESIFLLVCSDDGSLLFRFLPCQEIVCLADVRVVFFSFVRGKRRKVCVCVCVFVLQRQRMAHPCGGDGTHGARIRKPLRATSAVKIGVKQVKFGGTTLLR